MNQSVNQIMDSGAYKIHEFVAHATEVNCLTFGPKSHQVLATGGEDTKVNVWRVGSASNLWTLGQNKSPIESVCFDAEEQYIVSGARNGSIKVMFSSHHIRSVSRLFTVNFYCFFYNIFFFFFFFFFFFYLSTVR